MLPLLGEGIFTQDGPAWVSKSSLLFRAMYGTCNGISIAPKSLDAVHNASEKRITKRVLTEDLHQKHSRGLLRPQFWRQQYQDLTFLEEHVQNLLAHLPSDESSVELQPLLFKFTLDSTTAFLFGHSTHSLRDEDAGEGALFASAFDYAQATVAKRLRLLDLYWLVGGSKFFKACHKVHAFVDNIVEQRKNASPSFQDNTEQYNFFDSVAGDADDPEALRGQLLNVLLAGRDTTSSLLVWIL